MKRGVKINRICSKYKTYIENMLGKNKLNTLLIIGYGSNIYEHEVNSDLDVCIVDPQNTLNTSEKDMLVDKTILFHKENGLKLDEEVPLNNKLVFNNKDISSIFNKNPFTNQEGVFEIKDIVKTRDFLTSDEMKQRLFLNIFTTERQVIFGDRYMEKVFEFYSWKIIIEAIIKNYMLQDIDPEIIGKLLYRNPNTNKEGEWYLGYKRNNERKQQYIRESLKRYCKEFDFRGNAV